VQPAWLAAWVTHWRMHAEGLRPEGSAGAVVLWASAPEAARTRTAARTENIVGGEEVDEEREGKDGGEERGSGSQRGSRPGFICVVERCWIGQRARARACKAPVNRRRKCSSL
jgi:hypothetical protein